MTTYLDQIGTTLSSHSTPAWEQELFRDFADNVYAIIDGAQVPELLSALEEFNPEYACLYSGAMPPALAACAPYLARLSRGHSFTRWFFETTWGEHVGVLVASAANFNAIRLHLRKFLLVKSPNGKRLYFRYYDPRVLRIYLPTCNEEELQFLFGPVTSFICESEAGDAALRFQFDGQKLTTDF